MERVGQRDLYAKGGITRWYWDIRDRAILRHTAAARSVLDIGCGEGITLEKVIRQNPRRMVLGIDPDPRNVSACAHLPVSEGSAYRLPSVQWDCCLLLDVIEHLSAPGSALREIHKALAKNGKLVIMFPNDWLFFFARLVFLKFKEAFSDHGHLWDFNSGVITDILQEMGFEIESTERLPRKWFPLHCLIVARRL